MKRPPPPTAALAVVLAAAVLICLLASPALAAASSVAATSVSVSTSVSVVEKVIQLLGDMSAKAKAEKQAEAVAFSKFDQFCKDTTASKTEEVTKGAELIEVLTADLAKHESDIKALTDKISELKTTIAKSQADLEATKLQREKDHKTNTRQIQDLAETTDALERAIATLQKENYDRKASGASLLQELSARSALPISARSALAAFLEINSEGDFLSREAPEAHAYEFQSGGVVELMQKLQTEFTKRRTEAEKEEMNSKHAHQIVAQDLTDVIETAESDISDSTALLEEKKSMHAKDTQRLHSTREDHGQDVTYLQELKLECVEKVKSFQEKQGLRAEEIQAIEKAAEILRSPEVLGSAKEHLPAAAAASAASFAQLRAQGSGHSAPSSGAPAGVRESLAAFLSNEGQRLHSSRLGLLAQQIVTSADPFTKVKGLIQDMITKLLREAGQESEHKGWCDSELGTNKQTRTRLQEQVDQLSARMEEGEASIAGMSQQIAQLAKEVGELTQAMRESTSLRETEKSKNEETIQDATAAQKAIATAVTILQDFYVKAGEATALAQVSASRGPIQYDRIGNEDVKMGSEEWRSLANPNHKGDVDRGHKEGMQTFGKTYKGQQAEVGGVLAILEVVAGDFGKLQAETQAAEAEAAKVYKDFMASSRKRVAMKEKESDMLTEDKDSTETQLLSDKKDLASVQDQLLAADRYFEKLKPSCLPSISYGDRAKAREAEIQSLQEALTILRSDEGAA